MEDEFAGDDPQSSDSQPDLPPDVRDPIEDIGRPAQSEPHQAGLSSLEPGQAEQSVSQSSTLSPWEDEEYIAEMRAQHDELTEHLEIREDKVARSKALHNSYSNEFNLLAHGYAAFISVKDNAGTPWPLLGADDEVDNDVLDKFVGAGDAAINQALAGRLAGEALDRVERAAAFDPPTIEHETLAELLAVDLPKNEYRVDGLMLLGGITLLSAPAKAAKTTCTMCLCKSLLDGQHFLGRPVMPVQEGRRIVYWDLELEPRYAVQQFARLGLERTDALSLISMKGYSVPFTTAEGKEWIIEHLRQLKAEIWILDTFSRVFGGEENSNTEVNAFLRDLDEIKRRADIREIVIIHHAGHEQKNKPQRARGASALEGWPDTLLTIERANPSNAEDTQRTLRAKGRGVTVPELHYDWDPDAFELTPLDGVRKVSAGQNKKKDENQRTLLSVREHIAKQPGLMQSQISGHLDLSVSKVRNLLGQLVEAGDARFETGDGRNGTVRNAKYYFATYEQDFK